MQASILDRVTLLQDYPSWFYECLIVPGCFLQTVHILPIIIISSFVMIPYLAFLAVLFYGTVAFQSILFPFFFLYFMYMKSADPRIQACCLCQTVLIFSDRYFSPYRIIDCLTTFFSNKHQLVKCFHRYLSCGLFSSAEESEGFAMKPRHSRCAVLPVFMGCLGRRLISTQQNRDRAKRYHEISTTLFKQCLEKRLRLYSPDDIRILELIVPAGGDPVESLLHQQRVLGCNHKIVAQTQLYISSNYMSNFVSASSFLTCIERFETMSSAMGLLHPETLSILLEVAVQLKSKFVLDWTRKKMERSIGLSHPLFYKYEAADAFIISRARPSVDSPEIGSGPLYPTHLAPTILEKLRCIDSLTGPPSKLELWQAKFRRFYYRSSHLDLDLFRVPHEMAILSKFNLPLSHQASTTTVEANSVPGDDIVSRGSSVHHEPTVNAASADHLPPKAASIKYIPSVRLPEFYRKLTGFPYLIEFLDIFLVPTPCPSLPPLYCADWFLRADFFPAAVMALYHIVPVRCEITRLICRRSHPSNDSPSKRFLFDEFYNLEQSIVNHALLSGGDEARMAIDIITSSGVTGYCLLRVLFDVFLKIALNEAHDAQSEIGELLLL
jgi:hypothetical protein